MAGFYETIAALRADDLALQSCVSTVLNHLLNHDTSSHRPGVLLGKIQSGKTRAFLGIIASAFDNQFDAAVVLTKGTKTLAKQTIERIQDDFKPFTSSDAVQVFDIMFLPKDLTKFELNQKLIIVAKKEANNLERLLKAFRLDYPSLRHKKVLIIDDEADFASLSFRRNAGDIEPGILAKKIDELRDLVSRSAFLQVTATPYSLYLQPEEEAIRNGSLLFKPKKPAFTELLPIHQAYVGGEFYFEESADESSSAFFVYEEVPLIERDALQKEDGRRLKLDDVMTDRHAAVIRRGLLNFIVGGVRPQISAAEGGRAGGKIQLHCSHRTNTRGTFLANRSGAGDQRGPSCIGGD